ncbi:hypothetical protein E0485_17520 [Paenibacillus albiflavus]|uniref:FAD/FMN-containing dehydrogenase n=1 Tax=Paenibacillus albiflavus TaxID=2545760 RepID=A0A4V2WNG0_9BACL|nr:hypothetical protein [Paenibacillus albiflavus]TCZ75402.1 hypothetical protein E0485_17520 [Paenibacillus albiflavus]
MKTKVIAILGATTLMLGIGTAYAAEIGPDTFRDMIPFMKEMHPNLNDNELEQMYNDCHQRLDSSSNRGMMRNNAMMQRSNPGTL